MSNEEVLYTRVPFRVLTIWDLTEDPRKGP